MLHTRILRQGYNTRKSASTSNASTGRQGLSYVDIAHRTFVTGLAGLGIWGVWLTAAVWKSRRGGEMIVPPNSQQVRSNEEALPSTQQQGSYPVTNDQLHEPPRAV